MRVEGMRGSGQREGISELQCEGETVSDLEA